MGTYIGSITFVAIGLLIWLVHEIENNKKHKEKAKKMEGEANRLYRQLGKSHRDYKALQQNTVAKSQFFSLQKECELLTQQIKKHIENF